MRKGRRRGCTALLWALGFFATAQAALALSLEHWRPELRDPEFGSKLLRLRARLEESPRRPLLLVLGSSRVGLGLRPELWPPDDTARTPIVFNFGLTASGPLRQLLCLQRLLAAGIHPDQVVVEVMPPLLNQDCGGAGEADWIDLRRADWNDLPLLQRYSAEPETLRYRWSASRVLPWFGYRLCLLSRFAPDLVPWKARQDIWYRVDRSGWLGYGATSVTAEEYRRAMELAWWEHAPRLNPFQVTTVPDRAVRELLDLCRREKIGVRLLLMPEDSLFRSWYPPATHARLRAYLAALTQAYGVTVIDARTWVPDGQFVDGHHLLPAGAAVFTERFGRELLRHGS